MIRVGLVQEDGVGIRIFDTRDEGLEWMENKILTDAGWQSGAVQEALDLKDIELLREFDDETIDELRTCVKELNFKAGEKIFSQGDEGDEVFLIRRGIVRILLPLKGGKHHHLATFSRGDYFGEMSFLDKGKRSADAVAKTECELYVLSRNEFNDQVYKDAILGVKVFARLALAVSLRLRQTDIELRGSEDR